MKKYKVLNMDCASCASIIELDLEDAGIKAKCSYAKGLLELEDEGVDEEKLKEIVKKSGYDLATS